MRRAGWIVIISGPSGVGKTTLCQRLMAEEGWRRLVTCTTRPRRADEQDGIDYHFLRVEEFEKKSQSGGFLEEATVHGCRYGTPRGPVLDALERGDTLLLNIDVQGARVLRESGIDNVTTIFIEPPTKAELSRRLSTRATETEEDRERRLSAAHAELAEKRDYDHVVVNDDLEAAVSKIQEIVTRLSGSSGRIESR